MSHKMVVLGLMVMALSSGEQVALRTPVEDAPVGSSADNPMFLRSVEYPARALEQMVSGHAVVRCRIETNGAASACQVVEESQPGFGFGREMIRAAMKARVPTDHPSIGRDVYFRANFNVQ